MFYTKCPRIIPEVKDSANRLVDKWIRPILRRSANYKDTSQVEVQMTSSRYARKDGSRPVLYVLYFIVLFFKMIFFQFHSILYVVNPVANPCPPRMLPWPQSWAWDRASPWQLLLTVSRYGIYLFCCLNVFVIPCDQKQMNDKYRKMQARMRAMGSTASKWVVGSAFSEQPGEGNTRIHFLSLFLFFS